MWWAARDFRRSEVAVLAESYLVCRRQPLRTRAFEKRAGKFGPLLRVVLETIIQPLC